MAYMKDAAGRRLDSFTVASEYPAMGKWHAAVALRQARPCVWVATGSSSTQGAASTIEDASYVNRVTFALRRAFPAAADRSNIAVRTLATAVAAGTLPPGIQAVNAGVGSTQADTFLTSTTRPQVMGLNPSLVSIMVGANDVFASKPVATYKAQVLEQITALKALATQPFAILLIQSFQRPLAGDATKEALWVAYGQALRELAAADPDNVAFVDVSRPYKLVDAAGADPFTLISTDGTHGTNRAHELTSNELLASVFHAPKAPPVALNGQTYTATMVTSDSFSGANLAVLHGRASDAALGGSAVTIATSPSTSDAMQIVSGQLVRGVTAKSESVNYPVTAANQRVSVKVVAVPSSIIAVCARRSSTAGTTVNQYMAELSSDVTGGVAVLKKRLNGEATQLAEPVPFVAGDEIGVQCFGPRIDLLINGAVVASAVDFSITTSAYASLSCNSTPTFTLDDFKAQSLA